MNYFYLRLQYAKLMRQPFENYQKAKMAVIKEISSCKDCISNESLCKSHANAIKTIIMAETYHHINNLNLKDTTSD